MKNCNCCTTYNAPDLMDGGVAAALIEEEAENADTAVDYHAMWWKAEREREKAERERDEARGALRARLGVLAEPRPLTPDAITDEMVLRFMNTYDRLSDGSKDAPTLNHFTAARTSLTRSALIAALTEPPVRPEGAEEIEAIIADQIGGDVGPAIIRDLADRIAAEEGAR